VRNRPTERRAPSDGNDRLPLRPGPRGARPGRRGRRAAGTGIGRPGEPAGRSAGLGRQPPSVHQAAARRSTCLAGPPAALARLPRRADHRGMAPLPVGVRDDHALLLRSRAHPAAQTDRRRVHHPADRAAQTVGAGDLRRAHRRPGRPARGPGDRSADLVRRPAAHGGDLRTLRCARRVPAPPGRRHQHFGQRLRHPAGDQRRPDTHRRDAGRTRHRQAGPARGRPHLRADRRAGRPA
jgi:hypothetical protein